MTGPMKVLLDFMRQNDGSWSKEAPVKVWETTLVAGARRGWLVYHASAGNAVLTSQGREAIDSELRPRRDNGMTERLRENRAKQRSLFGAR